MVEPNSKDGGCDGVQCIGRVYLDRVRAVSLGMGGGSKEEVSDWENVSGTYLQRFYLSMLNSSYFQFSVHLCLMYSKPTY